MRNSNTRKRCAEAYRRLQAAALIKLYERNELESLPDGPIDPRSILTPEEIRRVLAEQP